MAASRRGRHPGLARTHLPRRQDLRKKTTQLQLSRETVRDLSTGLHQVVGGVTIVGHFCQTVPTRCVTDCTACG